MSAVAVIDSLEFARAGQQLRGSLAAASLDRLDDVLFDREGGVTYTLTGKTDERRRPLIELRISGTLHLQCQRCLELLDYRVAVSNTLLVVSPGASREGDLEDPDAPDEIEANPVLDVPALVEDELLLSLPLAPRHAEGECESRLPDGAVATGSDSPFGQLAALKRPPDKT